MVRGMGFRLGTCRWPRRKGMFGSLHLGDLALIRCSEGTGLQLPGGGGGLHGRVPAHSLCRGVLGFWGPWGSREAIPG